MASNALRNYCEEILPVKGKRPLQLAAWRGNVTPDRGAPSAEEAMHAKYLSYAKGLVERIDSEGMHLTWLPRALALGPAEFDVEHLADVVGATNKALREGRYESLGEAIAELPFDRLSPHVIATVLRVMSPAKESIGEWQAILREATVNLLLRRLDPQRLLRGLY
jgi:hypothetical protein